MAPFSFTLTVTGDTGLAGDDGTHARDQISTHAINDYDVDTVTVGELTTTPRETFTDREWLAMARAIELAGIVAGTLPQISSAPVTGDVETVILSELGQRAMRNAGPLADPS